MRVWSIKVRHLFEGGVYLRVAFIRGRRLFEGGVYSRAAFIFVIAFLAAAFIRRRCLIEEIR